MKDYFFFSSHFLLLFKEWNVDSAGVLVGAFVGLFLFTFIYEIAKFYQSRFVNNGGTNASGNGLTTRSYQPEICNPDEGTYRYGTFGSGDVTLVPSNKNTENVIPFHVRVRSAWTPRYMLSSLLFPLMVAANYFIMLAVMTYNAWLLISVCLASGLAYFLLQSDHDLPAVQHQLHHRDGHTTPLLPNDGIYT